MKGPRKLTDAETLKALELSAEADAAIREVRAMSKEDLDKDLEDAGFDLAAQRAKAAARSAQLRALAGSRAVPAPTATQPEPRRPASVRPTSEGTSAAEPRRRQQGDVSRLPSRRRPVRYLVLLAAALVVVAAAAAVALWPPPSAPVPPRPPVTAPQPSTSAPRHDGQPDIALLRREALDACKEMRWEPCLAALDLARRYDPAGESDPLVTLARQQATLALGGRDAARNENAKAPARDSAPGGED